MKTDPGMVYDGFDIVNKGVNSGIPSRLLDRSTFAKAVNVSFRGFIPSTRPGWVKRNLVFMGSGRLPNADLQNNFQNYIFQGAAVFERRNQIVVAAGGRLFRIRPDLWDVLDITPPFDNNNPQNYRAWLTEAEDFMIIQDGSSAPWIYDGSAARRSDSLGVIGGVREVPAGTAMAYSQGRLIVALTDGRTFVASDIVGGPSGTVRYGLRDSVIKFSENSIISGGGSFSVPINAGPIRSIRPVAQVDTSLGQGPTQIFTEQSILSFNAPTARDQWQNLNYPIMTLSAIQSGSMSDRATVNVNGDIWTRAIDGIRSFQVGRRDWGSWVNTPQSQEMDWITNNDEFSLLGFSSAAFFDNRLFFTVSPYRNFQHGVCHMGLAVIDFAPVSYLLGQGEPIWEGMWTGLNILQVLSCVLNGVQRCFIFALDSSNSIQLWEMTRERANDNNGSADVPIKCYFETGQYRFESPGMTKKRLSKGWMWANELDGSVSFKSSYRTNDDPCWHTWASWTVCSQTTSCGTSNCLTPGNLHTQYRKPFLFPDIDITANSSTGIPDSIGETFSVRIDWTGKASISRMLLSASVMQEDVVGSQSADATCQTLDCCNPNDYEYVSG